MPERYVRSPYAERYVRNDPTFIRPAEISIWRWEQWKEGRRPPTIPILHHMMPLHGPANVWHMRVEINNDCWTWSSGLADELSGPFRLTVKVPDMSGAGVPTVLERFLDQEIGL